MTAMPAQPIRIAPRYHGRPILRLVECYALAAVGKLSPHDETRLDALTPWLQRTFGSGGSWREIVEAKMAFDDRTARGISHGWKLYCRECGDSDPESFARAFADVVTARWA